MLVWIKERYGNLPMYITENGAAFDDPAHVPTARSTIRSACGTIREHLRAAHDAIAKGVDLRGYFAWSLLDNFEWSVRILEALRPRARRLRHAARTPKSSARFYADVIRSHGAALAGA